MALLLIPVAAGMAYYNFRLTGHALELPYVAHDSQYALLEPVLWQTQVASARQLTATRSCGIFGRRIAMKS